MSNYRRSGTVYLKNSPAGIVWEDEEGFHFQYHTEYLANPEHGAISLTLPLTEKPYSEKHILPFFDGLIPEGWLLHIAVRKTEIKANDRMGLLLTLCEDCIGAVSIKANAYEH